MPRKGFKHSEETKKKMSLSHTGMKSSEKTKRKLSILWKGENNPNFGKKHSEKARKKMGDSHRGKSLSEEHRKKLSEAGKGKRRSEETKIKSRKTRLEKYGDYRIKNIPTYNLYVKRLDYADKVRRNEEDPNILEALCSRCKEKWFVPTLSAVISRINSLEGRSGGESRLYCSEKCKHECPVFGKQWYSADQERPDHSREVQAQLAAMVLERDEYTCIKCGSKEKLECHHIEGIHHEPMESADMDVCVTFCESCHDAAHKEKGCTYDDMKCKIKDREKGK